MNQITDDELERALREAVEEARSRRSQHLVSIGSALRRRSETGEDPRLALEAALHYDLVLESDERFEGDTFGPAMEFDGKRYPPSLGDIGQEILELWARAVPLGPLAMIRARFADLLWSCRYGEVPHGWAAAAIDAYLEAVDDAFGSAVWIGEGLQRAHELTREVNDQTRRRVVESALADVAREALMSEDRLPGVSIPIIDLLSRQPGPDQKGDASDLLDEAINRYGADPWLLESCLDIRARLVDREGQKEIRRRQALAFADEARRSEGLRKYVLLQHASELAERHGLSSVAEELRGEAESMSPDDLGLREVSVDIGISASQVEATIAALAGTDSAVDALRRFGAHVPSGDPEHNRVAVEDLMRQHPIQHLVTRVVIDDDNTLVRRIDSESASRDHALVTYEVQGISLFGLMAGDVIDLIQERYSPGVEMLSEYFEGGAAVDQLAATRIAEAIQLFEEERYDLGAHLLAPGLERMVRNLAREVGLSVTKGPSPGGYPGGVRALGRLLSTLEGRLPEASRRYLRALLSESTGLNLRNRIAHGQVDRVTREQCALLIHAACHLRLLDIVRS